MRSADPEIGFTEEERQQLFILALGECDGNITRACDMARVERREYTQWMMDLDFAESVDEVAERILDNAEQHLQDAINDGNLTATIFFLKCKGKKRGYIERQEVIDPSKKPLSLTMNFSVTPAQGQIPNTGDVVEIKQLEE